jgi:hypothetical protein
MRYLLCLIIAGIACFILGMITDAFLQADFIRQKDDQIRKLNNEKKAIQDELYRRPDLAYDGNKYSRPKVEVIDIPQADKTYHMPW